MLKFLKESSVSVVKATTLQDGSTYGFAGFLIIIDKFCTSLILPVVAMLIALVQLCLQYQRYQRGKIQIAILKEELETKHEENNK